ncbi:hypothetical protein PHET_02156 [Paragonimus heterotremus]|uniref:Uncharacterized protein n=1 Tax=Paragonimus heterotremus TaxID=100268 RepID=A0A8J4TKN0_9TREM|nr:hypothetical protein PHET_02156 [Paragonimus heterotremus]
MSKQVFGIDVGSLNSSIAVSSIGAVTQIMENDYGSRQIPTCVAFGTRMRFIGTDARMQQENNPQNTLCYFTSLLGKHFNNPEVAIEQQYCFCPISKTESNRIYLPVKYGGKTRQFTPEQLTSMQLKTLKQLAESSSKFSDPIAGTVIAVPVYYGPSERQGMMDAATIAGLTGVQLLDATTAAALFYAYRHPQFPDEKMPPKIVVIVDVGHKNTQVAVNAYNKHQLHIIATACDPNLGGRDFDRVISEKIRREVENADRNQKWTPTALLRLTKECERLKLCLSTTNSDFPVRMDQVLPGKSIKLQLSRAEFEMLSTELLNRFKLLLTNCLQSSSIKPSEISEVELIGGGFRIPAMKDTIRSVFKQEGKSTMSCYESIARGCALFAEMTALNSTRFQMEIMNSAQQAITANGSANSGYTDRQLRDFIKTEEELTVMDKNERLRLQAKNALQTYWFEMKKSVEGSLSQAITLEDQQEFSQVQDWFDGEEHTQKEYEAQLRKLKLLRQSIDSRKSILTTSQPTTKPALVLPKQSSTSKEKTVAFKDPEIERISSPLESYLLPRRESSDLSASAVQLDNLPRSDEPIIYRSGAVKPHKASENRFSDLPRIVPRPSTPPVTSPRSSSMHVLPTKSDDVPTVTQHPSGMQTAPDRYSHTSSMGHLPQVENTGPPRSAISATTNKTTSREQLNEQASFPKPTVNTEAKLERPVISSLASSIHDLSSHSTSSEMTAIKKTLESSIFDLQSKLQSHENVLLDQGTHVMLSRTLNETKNWLRGDSKNRSVEDYTQRLEELRRLERQLEPQFREAQREISNYEQLLERIRNQLDRDRNGLEHLSPSKQTRLQNLLDENEYWLVSYLEQPGSTVPSEYTGTPIQYFRGKIKELNQSYNEILTMPERESRAPTPSPRSKPGQNYTTALKNIQDMQKRHSRDANATPMNEDRKPSTPVQKEECIQPVVISRKPVMVQINDMSKQSVSTTRSRNGTSEDGSAHDRTHLSEPTVDLERQNSGRRSPGTVSSLTKPGTTRNVSFPADLHPVIIHSDDSSYSDNQLSEDSVLADSRFSDFVTTPEEFGYVKNHTGNRSAYGGKITIVHAPDTDNESYVQPILSSYERRSPRSPVYVRSVPSLRVSSRPSQSLTVKPTVTFMSPGDLHKNLSQYEAFLEKKTTILATTKYEVYATAGHDTTELNAVLRKLYRQVSHYAAPSYHMQKLKQALEDAMHRQNPDPESVSDAVQEFQRLSQEDLDTINSHLRRGIDWLEERANAARGNYSQIYTCARDDLVQYHKGINDSFRKLNNLLNDFNAQGRAPHQDHKNLISTYDSLSELPRFVIPDNTNSPHSNLVSPVKK